jgi:tetratricopeptide (TPR) repeat protein
MLLNFFDTGESMRFILKVVLAAILNLQMLNACYAGSAEVLASSAPVCVSLVLDRAAAIHAKDWPQVERLAEESIRTCTNFIDTESLAGSYESVSTASLEQNNFKKALSTSEICISIYYALPECHLRKVEALIALRRFPEAKATLDKVDRLIAYVTSTKKAEMITARNVGDRKLVASKLELLDAQKSHASALRTEYFSK